MKTYIKPSLQVYEIEATATICQSGGDPELMHNKQVDYIDE